MYNKFKIMALLALLFTGVGCYQGPPPVEDDNQPLGDFAFSGYQWTYKDAGTPVGPGPNRFAGTTDYSWVDDKGRLHLKIAPKNNQWFCSEIVSTKIFSYGTYIFTCESDISTFNEKVVFGFFTWDNASFQEQANSEIDIEFSRWGSAQDSTLITYAAQPVWFSNPAPYTERTFKPNTKVADLKVPTTHVFKWTADSVHWESYLGDKYPGTTKIGEWTFNNKNMPRQKIEGNRTSNPVVIPAPSDSTQVRFNFWLLGGAPPSNAKEHEIIISSFKYYPI